jgi:hypothetical protein
MFSELLTVILYCLSLALLVLVFWRNVCRRLPVFTLFVVSFVTRDVVFLFFVNRPFTYTLTWYYIFWISEFILSAMYLFVIAEVARLFLRDYPSIWRSASRLLAVVGIVLTTWTVYSAMRFFGHPRFFFTVGDQRLMLTVAVLILLLMAIGSYYRLKLHPLYRLVLIGIGIYASVQVVTNQIEIQYRLASNTALWDFLRRGSFGIGELVWIYAVWRWAAAAPPVRQSELITQSEYDHLSPRVHNRLQDVIQKLASMVDQRP